MMLALVVVLASISSGCEKPKICNSDKQNCNRIDTDLIEEVIKQDIDAVKNQDIDLDTIKALHRTLVVLGQLVYKAAPELKTSKE